MKFARFVVVTSFLLLAMSQWSNASETRCITRLTNDYSQDSITHTMDLNDYEVRDYGNDHLAFSIKMIRNLLSEVGCSRTAINFGRSARGRSHNRCDQVLRGVPGSRVCYVETNLGYFFVTRDMLTNVHVTFNRWD
ncbi:hypothetical protein A9Q84_03635 [Halobacteriovorax marinus]|uniref:Lipoprotein n=1 Tax=Halobacteriovorax marinus TaxID=97084 RepID=A0A1Y5FEA8_9BACT|nr:hypothetical protein A9Q84_03635 [Halobacteriovorax marinus]